MRKQPHLTKLAGLAITLLLSSAAAADSLSCSSSQVLLYKAGAQFQPLAAQSVSQLSELELKPLGSSAVLAKIPGVAAASAQAGATADISYDAAKKLCARIGKKAAAAGYQCEPDCRITVSRLPNDPYYSNKDIIGRGYPGDQKTAIKSANSEAAWEIETGDNCESPIVAVIDTGVNYNHPDLARNIWINEGEIAGNNIDDDHDGYVDDVYGFDFYSFHSNPMDDQGHGTHVAGTIGAVGNNSTGVTGMIWNTKIMALKFLGSDGSGYVSGAVEAINFAVSHGAKVLNNSWGGGGYSSALAQAIATASAQGVLVVAAAGNDGANNDVTESYPANLPGVLSVAAVDKKGNLASFSNYGASSVHIAAPGVSILSTYFSGYAWLSGTSMATPHVSGAAALAWCKNPDLSADDLKAAILESGKQVKKFQGKLISGAMLDMGALLQKVSNQSGGREAQPIPAPQTTLTVSDSGSNSGNISINTPFNIDITSGVTGTLRLNMSVGRFDCQQKFLIRNVVAGESYGLSAKLTAPAAGFDALTFSLSQQNGESDLAAATAPISGSSRSGNRKSALKACQALARSIQSR
ncbi:MAG: S8 family serine peptidase [Oligoflexia bacterium]|nr:S8 family serine peptidase [Oligoflexia bacterium]